MWEQTKDHFRDRLWVYAFHTAKDHPALGRSSWYYASPSEENSIHNQLLMDHFVLCLLWLTSFLQAQGFKTFLLCSKPAYSAAQSPYPFGWCTAMSFPVFNWSFTFKSVLSLIFMSENDGLSFQSEICEFLWIPPSHLPFISIIILFLYCLLLKYLF